VSSRNAQVESILYSFAGKPDGAYPNAAPVFDSSGNLYVTTQYGGSYGHGAIFQLSPSGAPAVLYSFTGGNDGESPFGALIISGDMLYGTSSGGGAYGYGTVFEVTTSGQLTTLYSFHGGADGWDPICTLLMDAQGNLYGTTPDGGSGYGTVFELTPSGVETVLYSFSGGTDGNGPNGGLVLYNGNLYGTTADGGSSGHGTVFEVTPSGTETVIYSFAGGTDGSAPVAPLIVGNNGVLYGTTTQAGSSDYGVVFSITTSGAETVLHTFTGPSSDGAFAWGPLVLDASGNLYGTTEQGGAYNGGIIFEITPSGAESVLYNFNPGFVAWGSDLRR
jgi:uncharacterized repeat protein (TIGR03803 family)